MIPWWRTELGEDEIRAVSQAIRERHINQGPVCRELEQQLAGQLGVPHVAVCSSGSVALYLALAACGVQPGDEVIVPAMSFIATAHAVLLRGAVVRLVDVDVDRPLIDPRQIEEAISSRTRAVIAVHLNGGACDMASILEIARRHDLKVIEDAAQAFASAGPLGKLGTLADAGTFSMSIAKLMTTGEGGFVATGSAETYDRLLKLRNQGVENVANNEFDAFGFNFRFTDMLAAVGLAQLAALPQKVEAARRTYAFYRDRLSGLPFLRMLPCQLDQGEVPLWSQIVCTDRERVVDLMARRGVQTRPINPPLCDSPHLRCTEAFPNARRLASQILGLPSGPHQDPQDLQRVVDALHEIADELPALSETGGKEPTNA
jgi:dTDP-4-amino-4,6-dideoxygalactose transaminase